MKLLRAVEKILVRVTLLGLVLLTTSQIVLTGSSGKLLDFTVPTATSLYPENQDAIGQNIGEKSFVTFYLTETSSLEKAEILVNGKTRAVFSDRYVTIGIYPGDLVELDTSFYSKPVTITIMKNDQRAIKIEEGTTITLDSERKALSKGGVD